MASIIDVSGLTLNPEEAREIGKLIIEKAFVQGVLSDNHDIETGVQMKTQIPFAGKMRDSLKAASGCSPNAGTGFALTQKYWDPEQYDARWTHCAKDLNNLLKLFQRSQRINPDFYDRIGSQEMGLVFTMIEVMLQETLPVKVWFSDKTAAEFPAGEWTIGTDLDLYNVIDGLFKQIFAEVTGSNRVTITENAGTSYALQELPADAAYNYFQSMVNAADSRLLMDPTAKILATRSMVDNYRDTLRNKTLNAGFIEISENGKQTLFFDGREVVTMHEWDRIITSIQDDGIKYNLPHRAVFTTPANIPVGTLSEDDLDTLDSWYEKKDKSNYTDVAFSLDAKLLENYMIVAAY